MLQRGTGGQAGRIRAGRAVSRCGCSSKPACSTYWRPWMNPLKIAGVVVVLAAWVAVLCVFGGA
jgi:hypothetical protein